MTQKRIEYKLMPTENQHGYDLSLVQYTNDEFTNGFAPACFDAASERDKYQTELEAMTSWEVEELL